ncbi:MAG: ferrous iron transport protein B [Bacteroidia bacterium]|nr:ferrous iron transport protein B [Bacteroidia bacterium]
MDCSRNCESCPFAAGIVQGSKCITVDVIGADPGVRWLDFSSSDVVSVNHKGRTLRFLNLTGDDVHIGREILSTNPDLVLNVVDSMHLESSLRLSTRLIDMDMCVVMAFVGYDKLLATDHSLDYETLGDLFGFNAALLDGTEESFSRLLSLVVDSFEEHPMKCKHVHVPYGKDVDEAIDAITIQIASAPQLECYHDRYLAVRLLEDPQYIYPNIENVDNADAIAAVAAKMSKRLERELGESPASLIRKARLGFIHGALQETLEHSKDNSDHTLLQKIDSLLTSRWLGFPLLILVLFCVFEATFTLGAYPERWIENGIGALGDWLLGVMAPGWLSSLLVDGIVQGVGAVLAFLPNIIILFFFLSLLEDTGYMARAAFLMDKVMHRIGLHGKSFIPMLIGFGCNVPAIMAARSIDDRRDRTLTMLMIPFMSCSARLPVYLLFVSAFFARQKALVMIGLYATGIVLSILFAFTMKRTKWFRKPEEDYVSELPAFRKPTWRNTGLHIWERVSDYLRKISTVILAASVIIWALEYFPAGRTQGGLVKEESYIAAVGRCMEPVMAPLGFDWKMNVCLLTGLPAKEAIVSTMGILYHTGDDASLVDAMRRDGGVTPAVALAFMLFVLLYFPCVATIATLKREAGGGWAAFMVVFSLLLAWLVAFLVFQLGSLIL